MRVALYLRCSCAMTRITLRTHYVSLKLARGHRAVDELAVCCGEKFAIQKANAHQRAPEVMSNGAFPYPRQAYWLVTVLLGAHTGGL